MKMSITQALQIAEKIDYGIRDHMTNDLRFTPLWQHQFLRESFFHMLQHADGANGEVYRHNFENVCALMAPDFAAILDVIETSHRSLLTFAGPVATKGTEPATPDRCPPYKDWPLCVGST